MEVQTVQIFGSKLHSSLIFKPNRSNSRRSHSLFPITLGAPLNAPKCCLLHVPVLFHHNKRIFRTWRILTWECLHLSPNKPPSPPLSRWKLFGVLVKKTWALSQFYLWGLVWPWENSCSVFTSQIWRLDMMISKFPYKLCNSENSEGRSVEKGLLEESTID